MRFERTINLLLALCRKVDDYDFVLNVDKNQKDPLNPGKNFPRINIKLRNTGSESRPDAELI